MQIDPALEWRRLSEYYRSLSDDELLNLAADRHALTETAQQVLRSEMQCRRLDAPRAIRESPVPPAAVIPITAASEPTTLSASDPANPFARPITLVPDQSVAGQKDDGPHDYTWKTPLCECETAEHAALLREVLRRAGIESWMESPGRYSRYAEFDLPNPRILVAADQFEAARSIAAKPIPQEIIDDSKIEVPEYVAPVCPKCGAGDPVLEGVDPSNTWYCEQCGERWSDPPGKTDAGCLGENQAP